MTSRQATIESLKFTVGDLVEAKWSGHWYRAKIIENKGRGWYEVKFQEDGIQKRTKDIRKLQEQVVVNAIVIADIQPESAVVVSADIQPESAVVVSADIQPEYAIQSESDGFTFPVADHPPVIKIRNVSKKICKPTAIRKSGRSNKSVQNSSDGKSSDDIVANPVAVPHKVEKVTKIFKNKQPVKRKGKTTVNDNGAVQVRRTSKYSFKDALDMLESPAPWCAADIFIAPPTGDNSDGDSADENVNVDLQTLSKCSRGLLEAECEMRLFDGNQEFQTFGDDDDVKSEEVIDDKKSTMESVGGVNKKKTTEFTTVKADKKKEPKVDPRVKNWIKDHDIPSDQSFVHILTSQSVPESDFFTVAEEQGIEWTPVHLFELFIDDEILKHIVTETNTYARLKNQSYEQFRDTTVEELRCFIGILFVSGYYKLPSYRMMWEESEDVNNIMISNAMRRNRFIELLRFIHFAPSSCNIRDEDKCSKVRPLLDHLKEKCKQYAIFDSCNVSVDESMREYFGKSGQALKQRMPSKPIRSGYKIWCLNLQGGFLHNFRVYQGAGSKNQYSDEFGCGPSVVLDLKDSLPEDRKFKFYIDNYFSSIKLAQHMKDLGHGVTGTLKRNMFEGCPVTEKPEMKKTDRGTIEQFLHKELGIVVCGWNDNNVVTMISNCDSVEPLEQVKRWNRSQKKFILVPQPSLNKKYNYITRQWVELIRWINQCIPMESMSGIENGIGLLCSSFWKHQCIMHGCSTRNSITPQKKSAISIS